MALDWSSVQIIINFLEQIGQFLNTFWSYYEVLVLTSCYIDQYKDLFSDNEANKRKCFKYLNFHKLQKLNFKTTKYFLHE